MSKIVFLHAGDDSVASFRYRVKIPTAYLNNRGWECQINGGETDRILVCSKPDAQQLELAKGAKKAGGYIIADIGDIKHFQHKTLGPIYQEMALLANKVVCPTQEAWKFFYRNGIQAEVIPDPYEYEEIPPHASENERLIWFGHGVNIKAVEPYLHYPNLTIVSNVEGAIPWSVETLHTELSRANWAIFPTVKGDEYKSANRLLNAVRAGVFPICDLHPAYAEFKDFCWVGDVRTGYRWAKHYRSDLDGLVKQAQDYIRVKYNPQMIGAAWECLLDSI